MIFFLAMINMDGVPHLMIAARKLREICFNQLFNSLCSSAFCLPISLVAPSNFPIFIFFFVTLLLIIFNFLFVIHKLLKILFWGKMRKNSIKFQILLI